MGGARKVEQIISMIYAAFFCTRVPALTTVIMRHRCTTKRALIRPFHEIFSKTVPIDHNAGTNLMTSTSPRSRHLAIEYLSRRKEATQSQSKYSSTWLTIVYQFSVRGTPPSPAEQCDSKYSFFFQYLIDRANEGSVIRSKDAYMLIYAKRPSQKLGFKAERVAESTIPSPPPWALKAVESMNRAHEQTCSEFAEK